MAHALVFDSGVGGLTVVAEIRKLLPDLQMTYAADDVFRPYGEKSELQLRTRLPTLLSILAETVQPDIIVIACNTASTTALNEIRVAVSQPVIGVVPAIKDENYRCPWYAGYGSETLCRQSDRGFCPRLSGYFARFGQPC